MNDHKLTNFSYIIIKHMIVIKTFIHHKHYDNQCICLPRSDASAGKGGAPKPETSPPKQINN